MSSTLRTLVDEIKRASSLSAVNHASTATLFMPVCDTKPDFLEISRSSAAADFIARNLQPLPERSGAARARSEGKGLFRAGGEKRLFEAQRNEYAELDGESGLVGFSVEKTTRLDQ